MKRLLSYLTLLVLLGFLGLSDAMAAAPGTQARYVTFSNVASTSATISWTNGSGANRLVLLEVGTGTVNVPNEDGNAGNTDIQTAAKTYTADNDLGALPAGTRINEAGVIDAAGNTYVVFNGSGNSVTVTGLTANTTYSVRVVEYNISTYNHIITATAIGNDNNTVFGTTATLAQATGVTISNLSDAGGANDAAATVTLTPGQTGADLGRLVVLTTNQSLSRASIAENLPTDWDNAPDDGAIDATITAINGATANKVAVPTLANTHIWGYLTDATLSVNLSGLADNTTYFVHVFEFNSDLEDAVVYNGYSATNNPVSFKTTNSVAAPTAQARYMAFSSVANKSATVSCLNGNGTGRFVVLAYSSDGTAVEDAQWTLFENNFATNGLAKANLANVVDAGGNLEAAGIATYTNVPFTFKVIDKLSGSSRTSSLTNLAAGTQYFVHVYEYNENGSAGAFNVSEVVLNPRNFTTVAAVTAPTLALNTDWTDGIAGVNGPNAQLDITNGYGNVAVRDAITYQVDVSTSDQFTAGTYYSFYQNLDVGNLGTVLGGGEKDLLELYIETAGTYYVRVRSVYNGVPSPSSSYATVIIAHVPPTIASATLNSTNTELTVTFTGSVKVTGSTTGVVGVAPGTANIDKNDLELIGSGEHVFTLGDPTTTDGLTYKFPVTTSYLNADGNVANARLGTGALTLRQKNGNTTLYSQNLGANTVQPMAPWETEVVTPNAATVVVDPDNNTATPLLYAYTNISSALAAATTDDGSKITLQNGQTYGAATSDAVIDLNNKQVTITDEGGLATSDAIITGTVIVSGDAATTTTIDGITFTPATNNAIVIGKPAVVGPPAVNAATLSVAGAIATVQNCVFNLASSGKIGITNNTIETGIAGVMNIGTASNGNTFTLGNSGATGIKIITETSHAATAATLSVFANTFTGSGTAVEFARTSAAANSQFNTAARVKIADGVNTGNNFFNTGKAIKMTETGTNYLAVTLPHNVAIDNTVNDYTETGTAISGTGFTAGFYHNGTNSAPTVVGSTTTYKTDAFASAACTFLASGPVLYSQANQTAEIGDVPYGTIDAAYDVFDGLAVDGNFLLMNNATYSTTELDIDHGQSLSIIGKNDANEDPAKKAIINSKWNIGSTAAKNFELNNLIFKAATALEIDASVVGSNIQVLKSTFDGNSTMPINITAATIAGNINIGVGAGNGNTFTGTIGGAINMANSQLTTTTGQVNIVNNAIAVPANKKGIYVSTTNSAGACANDAKLNITDNTFTGSGDAVVFEDAVNNANNMSLMVDDISILRNTFTQGGYAIKVVEKTFTGEGVTDNTGFVGTTLPATIDLYDVSANKPAYHATNYPVNYFGAHKIYGAAWFDLTAAEAVVTDARLYPSINNAFTASTGVAANQTLHIGEGVYNENLSYNAKVLTVTGHGATCKLGTNSILSVATDLVGPAPATTPVLTATAVGVPAKPDQNYRLFSVPTVELTADDAKLADAINLVKGELAAGTILIGNGKTIAGDAELNKSGIVIRRNADDVTAAQIGGSYEGTLNITGSNNEVSWLAFSNGGRITLTSATAEAAPAYNTMTDTKINNCTFAVGDAGPAISVIGTTTGGYNGMIIDHNAFTFGGSASTPHTGILLGNGFYQGNIDIKTTNTFAMNGGSAATEAGADFGIEVQVGNLNPRSIPATGTLNIEGNTFSGAAVVDNSNVGVAFTKHADGALGGFAAINVKNANQFSNEGYSLYAYTTAANGLCSTLPGTIGVGTNVYTVNAGANLVANHYRGFLHADLATATSLTPSCAGNPANFVTGTVVANGGLVSGAYYNTTNTGVKVSVPIANSTALINGNVQIQVSKALTPGVDDWYSIPTTGLYTIASGDLNSLAKEYTVAATDINLATPYAGAVGPDFPNIANGDRLSFRAIITDFNGLFTIGTLSANYLVVDTDLPDVTFVSAAGRSGAAVKINKTDKQNGFAVVASSDEPWSKLYIVGDNNFTGLDATNISARAIDFLGNAGTNYVTATLAGTNYQINVSAKNAAIAADRTYKVYAQDQAGNIATVPVAHFTADLTGPVTVSTPYEFSGTGYTAKLKDGDGNAKPINITENAILDANANKFKIRVDLNRADANGTSIKFPAVNDILYLVTSNDILNKTLVAADVTNDYVIFKIPSASVVDGPNTMYAYLYNPATELYGGNSASFTFNADLVAPGVSSIASRTPEGTRNTEDKTVITSPNYWNDGNTSIPVIVNIPAGDASLNGGNVRIEANKGGNWETVGNPENAITGSEKTKSITVSKSGTVYKDLFELTAGAGAGALYNFRAVITDSAGNETATTEYAPVLAIDITPPADQILGALTAVGGNVVDQKWNASNTSLNFPVTIADSPELYVDANNKGTIQLYASKDNWSSTLELGGLVAITGKGITQNVVITKEVFQKLAGFGNGNVWKFRARITDIAGNTKLGAPSDKTITVNSTAPTQAAPTVVVKSTNANNRVVTGYYNSTNNEGVTITVPVVNNDLVVGGKYNVEYRVADNADMTNTADPQPVWANVAAVAQYTIVLADKNAGTKSFALTHANVNGLVDDGKHIEFRIKLEDNAGNIVYSTESNRIQRDITAPTITAITSTTPALVGIGQNVVFEVKTNEETVYTVNDGGLTLGVDLTSAPDRTASRIANGTANATTGIALTYTVQELDVAADLTITNAPLAFTAPVAPATVASTWRDLAGNNIALTLPAGYPPTFTTNHAIVVDGVRPTYEVQYYQGSITGTELVRAGGPILAVGNNYYIKITPNETVKTGSNELPTIKILGNLSDANKKNTVTVNTTNTNNVFSYKRSVVEAEDNMVDEEIYVRLIDLAGNISDFIRPTNKDDYEAIIDAVLPLPIITFLNQSNSASAVGYTDADGKKWTNNGDLKANINFNETVQNFTGATSQISYMNTTVPSSASPVGNASEYTSTFAVNTNPANNPNNLPIEVRYSVSNGSVANGMTDIAGNYVKTNTGIIFYDAYPATATTNYVVSPNWLNADQTITVVPTDNNGSGVKRVEYKVLNGSEVKAEKSILTAPFDIPVNFEGNLTVQYRVIDNLENGASLDNNWTIINNVKIDKSVPTIAAGTFIAPINTTTWNAGNKTITWTPANITDQANLSGIRTTDPIHVELYDGTAWLDRGYTPNDGDFDIKIPAVNVNNAKVRFTAYDNANNPSAAFESAAFTISDGQLTATAAVNAVNGNPTAPYKVNDATTQINVVVTYTTPSTAMTTAPVITFDTPLNKITAGAGSFTGNVYTQIFNVAQGTKITGSYIATVTGGADAAGNTFGSTTVNFLVDEQAPTATSLAMTSNNTINNAYAKSGHVVTLALTASETLASISAATIGGQVAVANAAKTEITRTLAGNEGNGLLPFSFVATDMAGNPATITALTGTNVAVTSDFIAPNFNNTLAVVGGNFTNGTQKLTYTITETNLGTTKGSINSAVYSVNNITNTPATQDVVVSQLFNWNEVTLGTANRTIRVKHTDLAGNETEATIDVVVSNVLPTISFVDVVTPANGKPTNADKQFAVTANSNNGLAFTVKAKLNDNAESVYNNAAAMSSLAGWNAIAENADYTLTVTVTDAAGNTRNVTRTFKKDTQAPTITSLVFACDNLNATVTFSEAVSSVNNTNINATRLTYGGSVDVNTIAFYHTAGNAAASLRLILNEGAATPTAADNFTIASNGAGQIFDEAGNAMAADAQAMGVFATTPVSPVIAAQNLNAPATVAQLPQINGVNTVRWYSSVDAVTPLALTAELATGTYYATNFANGCESAPRTPVAVTVTLPCPGVPTVTAIQSYVYNNTVRTATATTVAGAELVWYNAANEVLATAPSLTNVGTVSGFVSARSIANACESAKAPFTLTITKANLTIAAANGTKVYGTVFTPANPTVTGLIAPNTVTGVTIACDGNVATAAVANYPIAVSAAVGTGLDNYNITYTNATLAVTPKALTITANNQTKVAGNAFAFLGTEFVATGLVNADAVNTVTLTSAGSAAAAIAGTYPIVPSAAVGTGLANYTIAYANGTFTVNVAPPAPANSFVFETIATQVSGTQFTVTVTSKNEFGAIAPVTNATDVTISYGSTTATATFAAGASTASVNFTLNIPNGLTGVTLSGAGFGTATSNAFTVLAAAPAEPISISRGLRNREWINLSWNGNGEDVMLVGISGNTMPALTLDGIGAIPAANSDFSAASALQGVKVLYMGSDVNNIQVTGLTRNLPAGSGVYTFAIYTYNGTTNTWNFSATRKELLTNTLSKDLTETETGNDFVSESFSVSSVAPNPVKDQVNFTVNALTDANFTVELFNANGETVLSQTQFFNAGSHSLSLDLFTQKGMIAAGSYFLRVTSEGETLTQPVVVMP